jgi:hypothetical protein
MSVQRPGTQQFNITDGSNQYTIYTDAKYDANGNSAGTGKVISATKNVGDTIQTLTRAETNALLSDAQIKTSLNAQFKVAGAPHSQYTNSSNALATQQQFNSETTKLDKVIQNTNTQEIIKGREFQNQNKNNVSSITNKRPPVTSGVIVFPSDLIVKEESGGTRYSQDTIRIKALKYKPPQEGFLSGTFNTGDLFTIGTVSNNQEFTSYDQLNSLVKNYDYRGEVILPMPLAIRDAVGAEWGIDTVNALALGLYSSIRNKYEGDIGQAGALGRTLFKQYAEVEAWASLAGGYGSAPSGGAIRTQVINNLTRDILASLGPDFKVDPLAALARSTGSVVNNNAELLFRGPKLRSFDCAWKLSPRSAEDSLRIRKMIRWFKINSLPYLSQTAIFMETPNVFAVQYTKANNERNEALPQFKLCALVDFRVDYAPDGVGWAAYEDDSQPITSLITATFHELTPLFANEYANVPEGSVGY